MNTLPLLLRKLVTSYILTIFIAIYFAIFYLFPIESASYYLEVDFLGWTFIYCIYIFPVLLLYGSPISIIVELIHKKGIFKNRWLYILLHSLFGGFFGIIVVTLDPFLFDWLFILFGAFLALLYAVIDRILYIKLKSKKAIWISLSFPVIILAFMWGGFQFASEPLPPFTAEDAIKFASEGDEMLAKFPQKEGISKAEIDGYHIIQETKAEIIDDDTYIIYFFETWSKNGESDSFSISYKIDRNSSTLHNSDWNYNRPFEY